MREACERIVGFLRGMDFDAFQADQRTMRAVPYDLVVLGEAAKGVSAEPQLTCSKPVSLGPEAANRSTSGRWAFASPHLRSLLDRVRRSKSPPACAEGLGSVARRASAAGRCDLAK
jgi:hypothetical protein